MDAAKSILHMPARLKLTIRPGRPTSDSQIPLARDRFAQIGLALRQFAHRRCAGVVAWSTLNLQAYSGSTSSSSCCLGPERRRGNFKRAGMCGLLYVFSLVQSSASQQVLLSSHVKSHGFTCTLGEQMCAGSLFNTFLIKSHPTRKNVFH